MEIPRALMAVLALSAALAASGVSGADTPAAALKSIALPRGRATGLAHVSDFVADAEASGLVAESIARAGLRGVDVAP